MLWTIVKILLWLITPAVRSFVEIDDEELTEIYDAS
jgi:hypothetical protein